MAGLKLASGLGLFLFVVLVVFMGVLLMRSPHRAPVWKGQEARMPCLANGHCPMGQKCVNGSCAEGFMAPIVTPDDKASCDAKECKSGINATCGRKASPCGEGTFCQNDACVPVSPVSQGEAYRQIGMLLD